MRSATVAAATGMAVVLAALGAPPAGAEDLHLGWAASFEYDDNIFNADDDSETQDKEEDVVFRTGPLLELRRDRGDLTYRFRYAVNWESFLEETGLDEFDHNVDFTGNLRLGPRTDLEVFERFRITRSLNRSFSFTPGVEPVDPVATQDPDFEIDRQRLKTNVIGARLTHQLTPRWQGILSLNHSLFDDSQTPGVQDDFDTTSDTVSISGVASLSYALSLRDRIGFGAGVTQQSFEDSQGGESDTRFFRVFGSWSHVFDPTMSLTFQAGPTLVSPDDGDSLLFGGQAGAFPFRITDSGGLRTINPATCPVVDGAMPQPILLAECDTFDEEIIDTDQPRDVFDLIRGSLTPSLSVADEDEEADDTITFFADVSFVKSWERWSTRLSFRRTDSTSSGQGASTILNVFTAQVNWEPVQRWRVSLDGVFSSRTSATDLLQTAIGLQRADLCVNPDGSPAGTELGGGLFIPDVRAPGACPMPGSSVAVAQSVNLRRFETDDTLDSQTLQGRLTVRRNVGRRSNVFLTFTYLTQDRDDDNSTRTFTNFRAMVGFRWWLDPLQL